ncbi:coenzyme A transferase, partial [mine drainage metagenome]
MCDLPNQLGALQATGLLTVMSELTRGRIDLGFLGAGEVDRYGNLNSTWVGPNGRRIRLPGSGGACDIASLARRVVVVLREEGHRFQERVTYLTSPGHGEGNGWRERVGLPPGGTVRVITQRGVYGFPSPDRSMVVESIHPGVSPEELAIVSIPPKPV